MKYLVHIGYTKAASTFLQTGLFSGAHDDIKPLGYMEDQTAPTHKPGKDLFYESYRDAKGTTQFCVAPFFFDDVKARQQLAEMTPVAAKVTCLSSESWCGHPFSGGVTAREYADRIHGVLPDAKILIVTRKQEDMLLSLYADALNRYYKTVSLEDFLFLPHQKMQPTPTPFFFCFDRLVQYYRDLFGAKNVLVLPFEIIKYEGEEAFMKYICDFANIPTASLDAQKPRVNQNDYKNYAALKKLRFLNAVSGGHRGLDRLPVNLRGLRSLCLHAVTPFISDDYAEKVKARDLAYISKELHPYIAPSNAKLQEYTSHELKELGYTVE